MMNRGNGMVGLFTAGLVGVTIGVYAASQISSKDRKKAMKRTSKMLSRATGRIIHNIL